MVTVFIRNNINNNNTLITAISCGSVQARTHRHHNIVVSGHHTPPDRPRVPLTKTICVASIDRWRQVCYSDLGSRHRLPLFSSKACSVSYTYSSVGIAYPWFNRFSENQFRSINWCYKCKSKSHISQNHIQLQRKSKKGGDHNIALPQICHWFSNRYDNFTDHSDTQYTPTLTGRGSIIIDNQRWVKAGQ